MAERRIALVFLSDKSKTHSESSEKTNKQKRHELPTSVKVVQWVDVATFRPPAKEQVIPVCAGTGTGQDGKS